MKTMTKTEALQVALQFAASRIAGCDIVVVFGMVAIDASREQLLIMQSAVNDAGRLIRIMSDNPPESLCR